MPRFKMPPPPRRQLPDQRSSTVPPAPPDDRDLNRPLENLMMDPDIMRAGANHDLQVGMKAARTPPFDNRFVGEEPRGRRLGIGNIPAIMRGRKLRTAKK